MKDCLFYFEFVLIIFIVDSNIEICNFDNNFVIYRRNDLNCVILRY